MDYFINVVLLFFAFGLIGWCIEVTLKYRQFGRFINRGFLMGPCLPIYGWGAVFITLSVEAVKKYDSSVGTTFVVSFLVCGTIEYLASYVMEKKFHARWWDYSQKPMNLNGRVWIGNLVLFGIGGLAIIYLADPALLKLFGKTGLLVREIAAGILSAVYIADNIMSFFVMKLVKQGVEKSEADNTEDISREIKKLLGDRSYFYRRFAEAYPDVIYKTEKIAARMEAVKAETEKLRKEAEQRMDAAVQKVSEEKQKLDAAVQKVSEGAEQTIDAIGQRMAEERDQLRESLETNNAIRVSILEKQDALLTLLYNEDDATDEMKQLKFEIDEKKEKLAARPQLKVKLPGAIKG